MVVREKWRGRGIDWEFVVSGCKLLHLEWINNSVLQCSTGNYIQSPGTSHNGKEYEKETHTHKLSYFVIQQKLPQHCKSTICQLKNVFKEFIFYQLYICNNKGKGL